MNRLEANRLILARLIFLVEKHPDFRFSQLLWHVGLLGWSRPLSTDGQIIMRDPFHDESSEWLQILEEALPSAPATTAGTDPD